MRDWAAHMPDAMPADPQASQDTSVPASAAAAMLHPAQDMAVTEPPKEAMLPGTQSNGVQAMAPMTTAQQATKPEMPEEPAGSRPIPEGREASTAAAGDAQLERQAAGHGSPQGLPAGETSPSPINWQTTAADPSDPPSGATSVFMPLCAHMSGPHDPVLNSVSAMG